MTTKGTSDLALMELWRRAVRKHWGDRCAICGMNNGLKLECHHIVKRDRKLLKYDWRNGILVHLGDCHEAANLAAPHLIPSKQLDYLQYKRRLTFKQYLQDNRLSENEWRAAVRTELEAKLQENM